MAKKKLTKREAQRIGRMMTIAGRMCDNRVDLQRFSCMQEVCDILKVAEMETHAIIRKELFNGFNGKSPVGRSQP